MAANIVEREWDAEVAGDLPERRWFALLSAIGTLQAQCTVLLDASKLADEAWRRACVQLAEFDALRDALEEDTCLRPAPPVLQLGQRFRFEARSEFRDAGTGWTAATS